MNQYHEDGLDSAHFFGNYLSFTENERELFRIINKLANWIYTN
jgi:hypothetical protein